MFGKKYFESAVVGASLLTVNCGESLSSDLDSTHMINPSNGGTAGTGGTENGGVGGSSAGSETGGMGGTTNCDLIQNFKVLQDPFDPLSATTGFADINVDLLQQSSVKVIIKRQGALIAQIADIQNEMPGAVNLGWGGNDDFGNLVPDGIYTAEVTASNASCSESESVDFQVASVITNCRLDISSMPMAFPAAPGTNVELGCYELRAANCDISIPSLGFKNDGVGDRHDFLSAPHLLLEESLIGSIGNFDSSGTVIFNNLANDLNVADGQTKTVCLESDILSGSTGQVFNVNIESTDGVLAIGKDHFLTADQITGNFPVEGNNVLVTN